MYGPESWSILSIKDAEDIPLDVKYGKGHARAMLSSAAPLRSLVTLARDPFLCRFIPLSLNRHSLFIRVSN